MGDYLERVEMGLGRDKRHRPPRRVASVAGGHLALVEVHRTGDSRAEAVEHDAAGAADLDGPILAELR